MTVLAFDDAVAAVIVGGMVLAGTVVTAWSQHASMRRHVGKANGRGPANKQLEDVHRRLDRMHEWARNVDEYHAMADHQRAETAQIVTQVAKLVRDHVEWETAQKYPRAGRWDDDT